jgi:hypothetical protein
VSAKVEEFQQIEPSRITCAFGGFTLSNVDMVIVISKIRVLQCHVPPYTEGINIELLSNDTPGQAVTTKDFGIIKIVTTYPGNFDYQTMWMRPSDAAKLERFLRNRQELHNPPAAQ